MDEAARELRGRLRAVLVPLVRAALVGEGPDVEAWRREGEARRSALRERLAGDPRPVPGLDAVWREAVEEAEADEAVRRLETISPILPVSCPLTLDDLVGAGLGFDELAQRVRFSAATG